MSLRYWFRSFQYKFFTKNLGKVSSLEWKGVLQEEWSWLTHFSIPFTSKIVLWFMNCGFSFLLILHAIWSESISFVSSCCAEGHSNQRVHRPLKSHTRQLSERVKWPTTVSFPILFTSHFHYHSHALPLLSQPTLSLAPPPLFPPLTLPLLLAGHS